MLAAMFVAGGWTTTAGHTEVGAAVPAVSNSCPAANIYVNSGSGTQVLNQYTPSGQLVSSVTFPTQLTYGYGDIAFNATGTALYGIQYNGSYGATVDTINPATGAVTSSVATTGAISSSNHSSYYFNGLSGLANGDLITGSYENNLLYEINPTTGASTAYAANLPTGYWSGGDFDTLPDGDIVALGATYASGSSGPYVYRLVLIHPDTTTTVIGTVPASYGMALSGGNLYLAGSTGTIWSTSVASLPSTASTATIPTTDVVDTGLTLYGATSIQDGGQCNLPVATPVTGSTTGSTSVTLNPLSNVTPGSPSTPLVPSTLALIPLGGGAPTSAVTIPGQGVFRVGSNGTITFVAANGFAGTTTPVTYQVSDSAGNVASSTVSVMVSAPVPTGGVVAATTGGAGYWSLSPAGSLSAFGNAANLGSENGKAINAPIVGIASTADGNGYWEVGSDGGVYAFGDAQFYGSTGGKRLNAPIVGIARTPDSGGYWLAAADGGVFAFGDAAFYGSMGGHPLNQSITGIAATPSGAGYWLAAADGGVFTFGNATFYGSMGGVDLNKHVNGIAATPDGRGYWLIALDGGVFTFGDAPFFGSLGVKGAIPITGFVAGASTAGYRLIGTAGVATPFGTTP